MYGNLIHLLTNLTFRTSFGDPLKSPNLPLEQVQLQIIFESLEKLGRHLTFQSLGILLRTSCEICEICAFTLSLYRKYNGSHQK